MAYKIELGDIVKDTISGFTGVAVGRTRWLYGCDRITVQPTGLTKEGKTFDSQTFDEPQLVLIKRAVKKDTEKNHTKGGPRAEPQQVKYKE